jgi:hypothetical protein
MRSAAKEKDGTVIIMVSAHDPGHANWLSTQFHQRGVIALRWLAAEAKQADPLTELITLS